MNALYFLIFSIGGICGTEVFTDWFTNITEETSPSLHLVHYGKKSYYLGNIFKGNFFHAQQFCRYHGMHLLSITSKEENDFLQQEISKTGDDREHFWTSGTKLPDSQKWIWMSTGRSISFKGWGPGQPDNAVKDEECIEIGMKNKQLVWNDIDCWRDFHFICEIAWPKDCLKLFENIYRNETQDGALPQIDIRNSPKTE